MKTKQGGEKNRKEERVVLAFGRFSTTRQKQKEDNSRTSFTIHPNIHRDTKSYHLTLRRATTKTTTKGKKKKKKKKKNGKQTPPLALFLHLQALTGHCLLAVPTSCEHAMSKSPQEGSPQLSRKSGGSVKKSRGRGAKAIWQKLCSDPTSSLTCSSSCIGLLPFRCHHLLLNPLWAPSALALLLFHLVQVFFSLHT